jgi:hypothetical protein
VLAVLFVGKGGKAASPAAPGSAAGNGGAPKLFGFVGLGFGFASGGLYEVRVELELGLLP